MRILFSFLKRQNVAFIIFITLFTLPNIGLAITEHVSLLTRLCNVILPLGVYWWLFTLSPKPGKVFFILGLFVFLAPFQLVLLYLFGEAPIAVDMFLNLVTTNSGEVGELLSGILPAVIAVVILYGGGIILAISSIRNTEIVSAAMRRSHTIISVIIILAGVILTAVNLMINPLFTIRNDIYPVNVVYNLKLAVKRGINQSRYLDNVADFTFNAHKVDGGNATETIILVVGETARAGNFEIYGYNRSTTPNLCSMQESGNLYAFSNAVSESNTTHKSVPMLLSALDARNFNDIYHQRGIITAFKEAGYHTAFISNQRRNHSFIDFFGEEADYVKFRTDSMVVGERILDMELIPELSKFLADTCHHKKFVVLHTYGSHYDYTERYSKQDAVFTPDKALDVNKENRDILINAYDNSIVNTDAMLGRIISSITDSTAVMLYTSDHGEDIFDDKRGRFLHASPRPTFYQIWIPFMIWVSDGYKASHGDMCSLLSQHIGSPVSSSAATFHTLMSLAGISCDKYQPEKSVATSLYDMTERLYLNDHNHAKSINEMNLSPLDADAAEKYRVTLLF